MATLPGLLWQRQLAALSQDELAKKANVQRPTITRIEKGGEARPSTIRKLVAALGCQPRDLLSKPPAD